LIDLLILGGGPAGVGAAFRAARRGLSVALIERGDRVGGAAGSVEVGGMRVDLGSHRLHPSIAPEILADLQALLGSDLQRRPRKGRIRLMGRWIAFPLRTSDLVRHMPPSFVAGATWDALLSPLRKPQKDTFDEVLRAGLGPTICKRFYFPYAEKIWGLAPHEISGEQARRRVTADSPLKIAARVIRGSGSGGGRGAAHFWYPRRGYGQISEAFADAAADAGADVRLRTSATAVTEHEGHVEVGTTAGSVEARHVFSTIPVTALARAMSPPHDVEVAARALRTRAMLLVYLVLDRARYTSYDAHYLPELFTPVTRVSEPKNYRDGDDPSGRTVLCAEIPCDRDDDLWQLSDDALAKVVGNALKGAELPEVHPTDVHVERLPFVYPIYDVGYEERFAVIDRWIGTHERVVTFGRQGLFAHDNAHHALAMAYAAVDCLVPNGGFDLARWTRAREGFAAHVVED
jgi:protoporphyrinogen oxidase